MNSLTAKDVKTSITSIADADRAAASQRFFKTGKGEYGEGDVFVGVSVPNLRKIAKEHAAMSLSEVEKLLHSTEHEFRLTALIIMTLQFEKASEKQKEHIYRAYLKNSSYINNWDLVDTSAHKIVGPYLDNKPEKMKILHALAKSENMWERRIAIVSTLYYSGKKHSSKETMELAVVLLHDTEDLLHKAVGWALREAGKNVSEKKLEEFLDEYATVMPRTMLRYAIERLPSEKRVYYLAKKNSN